MFSYTATTATYTYRRPLSTLLPLPFFCGPRLGPAFQQGPQRFCRGIIPFERQVVGEQDEAALQPSQPREQRGERRQRVPGDLDQRHIHRSEEHTSELQSLMRISYAVFCLKKKNNNTPTKKTASNYTQQTK